MAPLFGILSVVVGLSAEIPYFKGMLKKEILPDRGAFIIWSVLNVIFFAIALSEGGTWSLIYIATGTISASIKAVFALKYNHSPIKRREKISLAIVLLSLAFWPLTSSPLITLVVTLLIDLTGTWLFFVKIYSDPWTESLLFWGIVTVSALLSIFAVRELDPYVLVFPVYVVIASIAFNVVISLRRRDVSKPKFLKT